MGPRPGAAEMGVSTPSCVPVPAGSYVRRVAGTPRADRSIEARVAGRVTAIGRATISAARCRAADSGDRRRVVVAPGTPGSGCVERRELRCKVAQRLRLLDDAKARESVLFRGDLGESLDDIVCVRLRVHSAG